ncbi:Zeta toxin [Pseudomonas taeanensis MS-3]|uniref:Zeta toxin n=3 Tax=Pseudomonas TaxID=286 RepID=A0A0A1YDH6_9PSED|nr:MULTISPECIES: zeta toxin family protein [Pseudomonas]KFX67427.1 Zeta toxin [Pseudomonas taeanensis MS-3]MDA7085591.1 zeta toxin family protein [Pseudomonas aestuarii]
MSMTDQEKQLEAEALAFAKANKKAIAKRLTDPTIFLPEDDPVSVFMAGSPGAGKTETSIELLELYQQNGNRVLRIDPDELRNELPGYTGDNSWLFQRAISILVEKIHDLALKQKQSFLLDGTLSNYEVAEKNLQRSLDKLRFVQILYVYQEPQFAWDFVRAREAAEGRRIRPEHFIQQYFAARDVVNRLKRQFGKAIRVDLLQKDNDGSHRSYHANIDQIDNYVAEKYDRASLERMLNLSEA